MHKQKFQDQEMLADMLAMQKQASASYNMISGECSNMNLKNDMLNILRDEQSIQSAVFGEMHKRGWYPTPPAQQQMVDQAKCKFEGIAQGLA